MAKNTRAKNTRAKTRPVEDPYETYRVEGWEWRILKHYQTEEAEARNPYARVFCATRSPHTYGEWEYGDAYITDIRHAVEAYGGQWSA